MSNRSSKDIINLANELVRYVTQNLQEECRDALEEMNIKTVPKNMGYKENPEPDKYQINYKYYETFDKEIEQSVKFVRNIHKITHISAGFWKNDFVKEYQKIFTKKYPE